MEETENSNNSHAVMAMASKISHIIVIIIITSQSALAVISGVLICALGDSLTPLICFILLCMTIAIESIIMAIIWHLTIYPLKELTVAIGSLMSSDGGTMTSANTTTGPVKEELSDTLQFVYRLAAESIEKSKSLPSEIDDERYRAAFRLLSDLPIGIIALDNNFRIITANDKAPVYATVNDRIIQLDFQTDSESLEEWFMRVRNNTISATKTWTRVQNIPAGSLQERHVYDIVANYRVETSSGYNLIVVSIDRTEDYAESEDNIDFVSLAAHELRGPITVIRGYLDMLDEKIYDTSPPDQQALLDRLNVSAKRLTSYINNILNANRFDHHHLKLELTETTVDDIIDDVRHDLDLRASTVNRHITWDIAPNLPTVAADRGSISEVLTNFTDNAIKYSHNGGEIKISARQDGDFVDFSVADNGIGIPSSALEHLFTKFYRSRRSATSVGGTGIGLYISRGIIESHGGNVAVNSVEGKGSTFSFRLPIYATVKDKLAKGDNSNLISEKTKKEGWIDNHGAIIK